MTHYLYWRKWLPERHGQLCRVLCRGRNGNLLVEFQDGVRHVMPWRAVRKL